MVPTIEIAGAIAPGQMSEHHQKNEFALFAFLGAPQIRD